MPDIQTGLTKEDIHRKMLVVAERRFRLMQLGAGYTLYQRAEDLERMVALIEHFCELGGTVEELPSGF